MNYNEQKFFPSLICGLDTTNLRLNPKNIFKTTFRTRYGYYEFIVMRYGLTNAPTTFIDHINRVSDPIWTSLW